MQLFADLMLTRHGSVYWPIVAHTFMVRLMWNRDVNRPLYLRLNGHLANYMLTRYKAIALIATGQLARFRLNEQTR